MLGRGLAVAALVALVDQLAKAWILYRRLADSGPPELVQPFSWFFSLTFTENRGMSFGLFNNEAALNTVIFTTLAGVIVGALVVWLKGVQQMLLALALGLVIGGAIGNVIDRLWRGAVVDFLEMHLAGWRFPWIFNVADAAISVGVGLMVIDSLLGRGKAPNPSESEGS
jgi:signal peptidase II